MARTVKPKFVIAGSMKEYDDYVAKKVHGGDPDFPMDTGVRHHDFIEVSGISIFDHAEEDALTPITGVFIGTYKKRIDLLDITWKIKELNKWPLTKELFPGEKELWKAKWVKEFTNQKHYGVQVGDIQYNPYTDENMVMTDKGFVRLSVPVQEYADDGGTGATW